MDVRYGLLLKKSWNDLKSNLIIFLPLLYSLLFLIALAVIVGLEIGLFFLLGFALEQNWYFNPFIISYIIFFGIIDLLLLILIGSSIEGMYVGILNKAVTKNKALAQDMWGGFKNFTFVLFRVKLIQILLFIVPIFVLASLVLLAFLASKPLGIGLAIFFGLLGVLYVIILALIFSFGFFYLMPILSQTKINSAVALIKKSIMFTKENFGLVIIPWAITIGINLIIKIISEFISWPARIFPILVFLIIPFFIIGFIISIIVNAQLQLFLFNCYFNNNIK